jgi:hypothetical protein
VRSIPQTAMASIAPAQPNLHVKYVFSQAWYAS